VAITSTDILGQRRWTLPGAAGGYLVARAGDAPSPRGWSRVPGMFARGAVERAISSDAPVVYELHEVVGGTRRSGLSRTARAEHHREIARRLDEAFRSGDLVAYRRHPPAAQPFIEEARPEPEPAPEEPIRVEPESYVTIQLVGEDGAGIPGMRYRLRLPDATVREGTLDGSGFATVRGRFSGACQVAFPELDAEAWEPV